MEGFKCAVLTKTKTFSLENRDKIPSPAASEVLIRVRNVGICGSDVHYWAHGKCGAFEVKGPLVLGHESSGEIVAVGEGVRNFEVGDRVVMEPGVPCKECVLCLSGKYNLCPEVAFHATPPYDGTLQEFITHPASFCFKLPSNVSMEEGALVEPLSVAVHACDRAQVGLGCSVLITGAGPIGLVCVLAAQAAGVSTIIISDVNQERLKTASELGATHTLDALSKDFVQRVLAITDMGVDVSMDASGAEPAIRTALRSTRPGGKFVSIGRGSNENVSIPFFEIMDKEIDILGVFRYRGAYGKAVSLLAAGKVNVKPLITHRFKLDSVLQAFETAESGKGIKVMISVSEPQ